MFICQYCNREFSNAGGHGAHFPYCKSNPQRIQRSKSPNAHRRKGSIPWNKGQTKETDDRIMSGLDHPNYGKGFCSSHSQETKDKLSKIAKSSGLGGRVEGSGRGKKGWYKGFFCDSSWELAYLIYQLEHDAKIERCKEVRSYEWEGKQRKYFPDFVVEGKIVEIKGYKTKQWEAKQAANPDVICLYSNEMTPYINYVTEKYGKDYIKLYGG